MNSMNYRTGASFAMEMDENDPLKKFRGEFDFPKQESNEPYIYLCGNSLGLRPHRAVDYVLQELEDWAKYGVEGHLHARKPWLPYHEFLTVPMSQVVGGLPEEVVVMNSLTVNLHLMMVSFYRPTSERYKILIDYSPFPSDRYAVESQVRFHGFDPKEGIIELEPDDGESVSQERILEVIEEHGAEIALIMIGGVNYYTGQLYPMSEISRAGHEKGCFVGFDLAHGAGNIDLRLHESGCDFAVWCSYKYLNSGPGGLSGCFVHNRHHNKKEIPRFEGWWGHDKSSRFKMPDQFVPLDTVEAWQLSNPPILPMASLRASLELFEEAGMEALRKKSLSLSGYLMFLLDGLDSNRIRIITPREDERRGSQVSIQVQGADKELFDRVADQGVIADWREPDVIRVAPVPLYNSYEDIHDFYLILKNVLE